MGRRKEASFLRLTDHSLDRLFLGGFFFFFFPKFFFYSPISAKEKSVEREQLRLSKCAASGKCVI